MAITYKQLNDETVKTSKLRLSGIMAAGTMVFYTCVGFLLHPMEKLMRRIPPPNIAIFASMVVMYSFKNGIAYGLLSLLPLLVSMNITLVFIGECFDYFRAKAGN